MEYCCSKLELCTPNELCHKVYSLCFKEVKWLSRPSKQTSRNVRIKRKKRGKYLPHENPVWKISVAVFLIQITWSGNVSPFLLFTKRLQLKFNNSIRLRCYHWSFYIFLKQKNPIPLVHCKLYNAFVMCIFVHLWVR